MGSGRTRVWRLRVSETVLLAVAAGWSALVLPLGVAFAPTYSGVSVDSVTGVQTSSTATMVEVNGRWVLWYAFAPLVVTAILALLLWTRGAGRGPGAIAWIVTGLLAAFTMLAMMTIGLFILPVTGCLIAVCCVRQAGATHRARVPRPPRP